MKIFLARYILPVTSEIIENGAVVVDKNKIVDFGHREEIESKFKNVQKIDLKNALIMPGFVNAHTHLELSNIKIKIKEIKNFRDWLAKLMTKRDKYNRRIFRKIKFLDSIFDKRFKSLVRKKLVEMINSGTIAIGDVTNTATLLTTLLRAPLKVHIFVELIAFDDERGKGFFEIASELVKNTNKVASSHNIENLFRVSLSAHAPYSVSENLFKMIKNFSGTAKTSVHLAEPVEEIEFIKNGTGFFYNLLVQLGRLKSDWKPPATSPVKYLDSLGFLDENTLAVHCVNVDDEDIEILSSRKVSVCTCPRSNFFLKVGKAPVRKFLDSGINVCLGTDSLTSNRDLNILHELRFVQEFYPDVSDEELIKIATINGAKALGFDNTCGSIEKGKDSDLIFFAIPKDLRKDQIYDFIFQSSICGRLS